MLKDSKKIIDLSNNFLPITPLKEKLDFAISFRDDIEIGKDKPEEGADVTEDHQEDISGSNINNDSGWTDDTAADAAQDAADTAQADADAAQALLNDIADDAKITPVEKLTIKPLWDAIVAEKSDIDTQADTYSVSKTAYGTAYTTLNTYLNTTVDVFDDMEATTDITRATWDVAWEGYYNAKIEILNAIANAIQNNVATAQAAADAAQADADTAQGELDDIADDVKITPVEKLTAKQLWDAIVVEGTATTGTIPAAAIALSVATTDFDTAYAALDTYLNTTIDVFDDMEATTTITRADWDTAWKNYYDERTQILNAIAAKAATVADWSTVTDDGHKPADDATVGAQAGSNLVDSGSSVLDDTHIKNIDTFTAGLAITKGNAVYYYNGKVYPSCAACPISCYQFIGFALENIAKNATGKVQLQGVTSGLSLNISADEWGYLAGNTAAMVTHSPTNNFTEKIAGSQELSRIFTVPSGKNNITHVYIGGLAKVGNPGELIMEIFDDSGDDSGPGALLRTASKTAKENEIDTETIFYLDRPLELTVNNSYHVVLSAPNGDTTANYYTWHYESAGWEGYITTDGWSTNTSKGDFGIIVYYHSQTYGLVQDEPKGVNSQRIYEVVKGLDAGNGVILHNSSKYWSAILEQGLLGFPSATGKIDYRIGFRAKMIRAHAICDGKVYYSEGWSLVNVFEKCRWFDSANQQFENLKIVYLYTGTYGVIGNLETGLNDLDKMKFTINWTTVSYDSTDLPKGSVKIYLEVFG